MCKVNVRKAGQREPGQAVRRVRGGFRGDDIQGRSLERSRIGLPGQETWTRGFRSENLGAIQGFEKEYRNQTGEWKYKRRLRGWLM